MSAESFVAACYVKACAPPPVGDGGSMGHEARVLAKHLVARAKFLDKSDRITSTVRAVAAKADGAPRLVKAAYKYKGVGSMTRKIFDKARERGLSEAKQAHNIADALRYTAVVGSEHYVKAVGEIVSGLEDSGIEVLEVENKWNDASDYKGIHVIGRSKTGQRFELQIHTFRSFAVQNELHKRYTEMRGTPRPTPARMKVLVEESRQLGLRNPVSTVPGIETVQSREWTNPIPDVGKPAPPVERMVQSRRRRIRSRVRSAARKRGA